MIRRMETRDLFKVENLGPALVLLRQLKNLTQPELAERIAKLGWGLTPSASALSGIENSRGSRGPYTESTLAFLAALDLDEPCLFFDALWSVASAGGDQKRARRLFEARIDRRQAEKRTAQQEEDLPEELREFRESFEARLASSAETRRETVDAAMMAELRSLVSRVERLEKKISSD